ncbi:hypothetical protein GO755_00015 [Spirosoma sp. HMF4905]|uniref:Uncharacterized protein n=1 Tax=Spirosoma arboris TaxID=2682092 RepID=A0A7K1S465_9BACT|nr:hypothetical protein [Spirosoma arboris]MVM28396.1 hypothetical protein [Spirosoma arboris]
MPTEYLIYRDYVRTIDYLFDTTGNQQRTIAIFTAVINQAKNLGKSGEWVNKELIFEAGGEFADSRLDLLRMNLQHGPLTDDVLDLYNERVNRFK